MLSQELVTHDSIGHLKTLCMSIYRLAVALSLNGNTTAHRSVLKKASFLVWIQLY